MHYAIFFLNFCLMFINQRRISIRSNTWQSAKNAARPRLHEIAKLKNIGIKCERRLVEKLTKLATGTQQTAIRKVDFATRDFDVVILFIILMFSTVEITIQSPIPTTTEYMPI